jgi:SAM-dependent methyltransferase
MGRVLGYSNSSRYYLDRLMAERAATMPPGSVVLDAGAGYCPYRTTFAHTTYETADFCQVDKKYGQIDYVCKLDAIPVAAARYDYVMCTQVLEHLPDPAAVLREFHRVLKPHGVLCLTAPLYYEEHEKPYDFYRYTQFGLQHLLDEVGYRVESIEWLEGYYGTLAHQFRKAGRWLPRRPADYGGGLVGLAAAAVAMTLKPQLSLLGRCFERLDVRHKYTAKGHCINYAVVARRLPTAAARAA